MDANFLAGSIRASFGSQGGINTLSGLGTLTINGNASNALGFANQAGNSGGTMILNGKMTVNNTGGNFLTEARNDNSSGNAIVFDTASTLTLNTPLVTLNSIGGTIAFNGTVAASSNYLVVQSNNVSFGTGHNSSSFGQDVFFWGSNRKLAVNGGTVLSSGRKIESQGANNELELNGANVINGANVSTAVAGNSLLLDVNANQGNMGVIALGTGTTLTLDLLGSGVTNLFFADSSSTAWNTGTVSILGFQENVIKFGTNSSGLTSAQLAAIDAGIYSLTNQGYLTAVPEPTALGLLLFGGMGLAVRRKRA
jgi:filamentous hemagglutinin